MTGPIDEEPRRERGLIGVIVLVVPILSVALVGAAWIGMMVLGAGGRAADGPERVLTFTGCEAARAGVDARLAFMGLPVRTAPDPVEGGFAVVVQLPGDPAVAAEIPDTLAATGALEIVDLHDGTVLVTNDDVAEVTVELPFLDAPHAVLILRPEAAVRLRTWQEARPREAIAVRIDGEVVYQRRNTPSVASGRLAVDLPGASDGDRMRFAARTAAVLQGAPLPCAPAVAVSGDQPGAR